MVVIMLLLLALLVVPLRLFANTKTLAPPILVVSALSSSSSSPRRPPRIRPGRQSPIAPSDETSYSDDGAGDRSRDHDAAPVSNNNNTARNDGSSNNKKKNKHEQALEDPSLLTTIRFSDRTDLHPSTVEALTEGFGLRTMTVVQARTYEAAKGGRSVLARSKTGSGKTLAFLLPSLERILDAETGPERGGTEEESALPWVFRPGRSVGCVVLAPTRELAIQIADQAEVLVRYHNRHRTGRKELRVACIYGGVKMQRDVRLLTGDIRGGGARSAMMNDLPTILVSTPSRLLEHLEGNSPFNSNLNKKKLRSGNQGNSNSILRQRRQTSYGQKSSFVTALAETNIVVLDETDRLLQACNQQETQRVLGFLARPEKRQTLLFSATFPRAVRRLLSNTSILTKQTKTTGSSNSKIGNEDYLEVDCIGNEKLSVGIEKSTNQSKERAVAAASSGSRIEESYLVLESMTQFLPALLTILRREQERDKQHHKIIVFFPAGRWVRFFYQFFTIGNLQSKESLWEIHSRMSQSSRTRSSSVFRAASRGILFSSDVSARGLDYPDVSLVVQMGAPSSDKDYVHRIGRTGRAGNTGRGILVLLPFEEHHRAQTKNTKQHDRRRNLHQSSSDMVSYRKNANLTEDRQLASWLVESPSPSSLYQACLEDLEPIRNKVRSGHVVLTPGAEAAYRTFLAQYAASDRDDSRASRSGNHKKTARAPARSEILSHAKDLAEGTGLLYTPELDDEFASKLGLPKQ